ncbi:MAG: DNA polymerase III subunit delta [Mogibacterium sp.]|nr:DNA polymerase III subunit delta [Mogibacterium sp.]
MKDLKDDMFRNGILLYGSEDFLIRWALRQLIDRYTEEGFREHNLIDCTGDNADLDDLIGRARTPSMFPGHRIIVIRNLPMLIRKTADASVKGEGQRLLDYVAGTDHDAHIILVLDAAHDGSLLAYGKKMEKAASAYRFDRLTRPELRSFILKRIRQGGKIIGSRQLDWLIDQSGYLNKDSGYSLSELENDLNKIILAAEGDEITIPLIDDLLTGEEDKYVFHLIDALVAGRKQQAMEMTIRILASEDSNAMQLIGLLTSQFEMMLDAAEMEARGIPLSEMAKRTGVNEFRFRKAFQASQKFSPERLRAILIRLYNTDLAIKTGDLDKDLALELFLLGI